ncbi:tudor domain-containing protein 7 isoform X2 [Periplaneta americana]
MRTSRRSPPSCIRQPLSVTVSNNQRNSPFEKPRHVSFASSPSPEPRTSPGQSSFQNNNTGNSSSKPFFQTYEKPPRFQRLHQEAVTPPSAKTPVPTVPTVSTESTVPTVSPVPVSNSVPLRTPESSPSVPLPQYPMATSRAQDRLLQAVTGADKAAKKKNLTINLNGTEPLDRGDIPNTGNTNVGGRTIISPLTPLHARLNAAVRKPLQVQVMSPLEEQLAATTLENGVDYIKKLEEFTKSKGMSTPLFKAMPRMSGEGTFYSCFVKIDEFRISSYPDERLSPASAMQLAAKRALEELKKLSSSVGGSATQDKNIIMSRISHIVGGHRSGIWSTQIPIDYHNLYNETLPDDWLQIMARCPLVVLEHVAGNRIIVSPNWPASPTEVSSPTTVTPTVETPHGRPSLSPIGPAIPETITLPQADAWDVFVTCGKSTDEVWARLIGEEYSVKYENLATDMEMFYLGQTNVVANPEIGSFYAIKIDDCWHRVELVEMDKVNNTCQVFFIDHGDEESVNLKDLHVLERRFARLPAQAIRCFLWGLEDFADEPNAAQHITDTIVGKTLVASIKSPPKPDNPGVGLILFDTSTDDDLNMNNVLIENICSDIPPPQLPAEGKVQEMFISHITNTGDVYLQFDTYNYVQSLVSNVIETGMKEDAIFKGSNVRSPDPSRLYLARYHLDGNWYRAAITKRLEGQREVEVIFVDFGNSEVINPSDLIVLDSLKKAVAEFPHQAIKVHLHKVPCSSFSEKMALRVRELVPFDERILVKTVSHSRAPGSVPVVEIFKRIQPDNLLVSISETLAYEPDPKPAKSTFDEGNTLRGKKRLERLQSLTSSGTSGSGDGSSLNNSPLGFDSPIDSSSRGLSPPQIPDIGDYFDVHVTMAANPGNFTVQPYKDATRLEKLMEDMQSHYNLHNFPHPTPESVHEGGLYAAHHHDGHWYRVCVSNVINGTMVSVYFCDYGDVSVLPVEKLQPLTNQFKELPYQAIKAKLAGIQPKHSDWSVEDCLMFQELVVEHEFVSVIMETGPDLLNPSDTVIGLKLIDTSGEDDVYIDRLLIKQERAIATSVS